MRLFMVFDVESIGLHGDGYAVGWVVVDADDHGRELAVASWLATPRRSAAPRRLMLGSR